MASLVLLLSLILRPKDPNQLAFTTSSLPSPSRANAISSKTRHLNNYCTSTVSVPDVILEEEEEEEEEDVQEPKFCIDLSWP
ncbi:conserved hypothetical protein [Ricinus communis]|uniref:Uncharacterized protein n=1 Tax=Ricinus communis TaxID=3988 RepID=B9RZ15_RICCO|nr:conserved hypothetical protein [Ricinus communis]